MAVERSEVIRIAALAKLEIGDHEIERMTQELNDILEHCRVLQQIELPEVDPDPTPVASAAHRRPGMLVRDELSLNLSNMAPSIREGFFLVPRLPALDAGARDGGAGEGEGP